MYLKDSIQYTTSQIRKLHPQVSIPDGADLTDLGYAVIETVAQPTPTATQRVTAGAPEEYETGKWRETWVVTEIALDKWKQNKLTELSAYRYSKETAGITLNGALIKTDQESKVNLNGAVNRAILRPNSTVNWKISAVVWVPIAAEQIIEIGLAVSDFIEDCFTCEMTHALAINALETVEEVQAYDFTTGWPE